MTTIFFLILLRFDDVDIGRCYIIWSHLYNWHDFIFSDNKNCGQDCGLANFRSINFSHECLKKCVFFLSVTLNVCCGVINVEFESIKHFNDDDLNKMSTVSYAHKLYIKILIAQHHHYCTYILQFHRKSSYKI